MPAYEFCCRHDINHGCGYTFEIICSMSEIADKRPECPKCGREDSVFREWAAIQISPPIMTLGGLADKNAERMTEDHKNYLKEQQKTKKTGPKITPRYRKKDE